MLDIKFKNFSPGDQAFLEELVATGAYKTVEDAIADVMAHGQDDPKFAHIIDKLMPPVDEAELREIVAAYDADPHAVVPYEEGMARIRASIQAKIDQFERGE